MANMEAGARAQPARRGGMMAMAEGGPTGICADAIIDTVSGLEGGRDSGEDSLTMFLLIGLMESTPWVQAVLAPSPMTEDLATASLDIRPWFAQTFALTVNTAPQ